MKTGTSRHQDASRRFAEEYLNSPVALTLPELIERGEDIPEGELSFSDGVLCYKYKMIHVRLSNEGVPSSLRAVGVVCLDPEFMTHEWLAEMYPVILRGMQSYDPFQEYRKPFPSWAGLALFSGNRAFPITCWIDVASGEKVYVKGRIEEMDLSRKDGPDFTMRISALHVLD